MLRLVIEDGEGTTHVVPLIRDEITVGRQEGNTIRLTERNVSRHHARLTRTGTDNDPTVLLEDLHSYNGVRVNGERIVGKCSLAADDSIQIGDYLIGLEAKANEDLVPMAKTVVTKLPQPERPTASALPEEMFARLVVVSSNIAGQEYQLDHRELIIGRHAHDDNDLAINHRSISRNHAKIIWREKRFIVIDLGSANGVIVNGEAIRSTASLVNGDIIEMGHVKLRFCGPGDAYVFSPADIDDVLLPPPNPVLRYVIPAVILVGMLLVGYVLTDTLSNPSTNVEEQPRTTRAVAKIQKTAVLPAATVDAAPRPVRVTPKPEIGKDLANGRQALKDKDWIAAQTYFERVLAIEPGHREARTLKRQASQEDREKTQLRKLNTEFKRLKKSRDTRGYEKLLNLDHRFRRTSVYYEDASRLKKDIQDELVNEVTLQVKRHLAKGEVIRAKSSVQPLQTHDFAQRDRRRLLGRIDNYEKARLAEQKLTKTVKSPIPPTAQKLTNIPRVNRSRPKARRKKRAAPRSVVKRAPEKLIEHKPRCRELHELRKRTIGTSLPSNLKKIIDTKMRRCGNDAPALGMACMLATKGRTSLKQANKYCDRLMDITPVAEKGTQRNRIHRWYNKVGWTYDD